MDPSGSEVIMNVSGKVTWVGTPKS